MHAITNQSPWQRVSKRRRCPICDNVNWCCVSSTGEVVICARIQQGSIKEIRSRGGDFVGYLHRLRESSWRPSPIRSFTIASGVSNFPAMAGLSTEYFEAMTSNRLVALAKSLGLSPESLTRLEVGWSAQDNAYSFPMKSASGGIVGIRLRTPSGSKFSVKGSHNALFVPTNLATTGTLLICEGPTDTAAMLDLGFTAIGRPFCEGGVRDVCGVVKGRDFNTVVIFSDPDDVGRRGAENLASVLVVYHRCVRIIAPPDGIKDARAWKVAGAKRDDVQRLIDGASIRRLHIAKKNQAQGCGHE